MTSNHMTDDRRAKRRAKQRATALANARRIRAAIAEILSILASTEAADD
jgi:hypothetical protein